ncbi:serine/threonine-protein kinase [Roseateles sp. UC29_93]|uniref:serine/threonine-protein kinase n=1 Tax=Roseateles sp. UC29_93 TaxID=3350177 RepID=UPI003672C188
MSDTLPTTQPMPRSAAVALDDYDIGEEVGRGAMAVVHRAVDRRSGRTVAIKRLALQREFAAEDLIDVRDRFMREASAARHLDHPDILRVLDAGECAGETWIAMEYVVGQDLSHHTRPGQLLPLREVLLLAARLARALQYAHGHGVVHRDIKPANVMLERESGSVKIMDFGIARVADGSRTRTGLVLGTPSYMSPEQLAGLQVDGRSDLYSLGAMLFQLLTGHLPHQTESMATLMHQIMNQPAADVRRLGLSCPSRWPWSWRWRWKSVPNCATSAATRWPRIWRRCWLRFQWNWPIARVPPPPPAGQAFEQTLRLQSQGAVHNPLPPADPASKT